MEMTIGTEMGIVVGMEMVLGEAMEIALIIGMETEMVRAYLKINGVDFCRKR